MASRIAGITIEIGGNTTKLQTALKGVDNQLQKTQNTLKDVNKLLKLDPGNTELLTQKQKNLENAIKQTKERLTELKNAQSQVKEGTDEWDRLQREIIATEQNLKSLEKEYKEFGSVSAQQIKAAGDSMMDFGNKVSAVGQALKPVSAAAAGLVTGMVGLGVKAVTTADDLNTLSKQTGLSTDSLQKMQYAADRVDVSVETISGAVTKMKKNMAGTGEPFTNLGVSVIDASGHMRDAESVFYDTIRALSQIPNEVERDQAAYEIFGKSADELAGIIDDGGAAFRAYGDEAEKLGLILSGDTLNAINETNDAIDKSKAQLQAAALQLGATVATGLAPVIEKIAGGVEKLVVWLQQLTPEQTNAILTIAGIVAALAPLLIIGGKLITGIGMLMTFAPAVVGAFSGIIAPVLGVVAVIAGLIAIGVALYKNWDTIKEYAANAWQDMKDGWKNFKDNLTKSFSEFGTAAKQSFSDTWNNVKSATSTAWNNVKTNVSTAANNVMSSVTSSWNNVKSTTLSIWQGIKDGVASRMNSLLNSVQSVFSNIRSYIANAISAVRNTLNFSWSLPRPRLPVFRWQWIQVGRYLSVPWFSIEWYKKAYENPVMFTNPTVLQTPYGAKGFGDGNGSEIVLGMDKLRELVGGAGDDITINVYASPGMNVNELAEKIQDRLVAVQRQRSLAYGA